MAMPVRLTLSGKKQGVIDASCGTKRCEKTILVYSMAHDVTISRSPTDGLATGKRTHGSLVITKELDKSSPKLYQMLCTGEHMKNVTLKWYCITKQDTEEHYFTYTLEDAIIVTIKPCMPMTMLAENEPYRHMEQDSLSYKLNKWAWATDDIESEDS